MEDRPLMKSRSRDEALAYIRQCFENAETVLPLKEGLVSAPAGEHASSVSQESRKSQRSPLRTNKLSLEVELFEERAAIMEYDGEVPRTLAEYLARHSRTFGP